MAKIQHHHKNKFSTNLPFDEREFLRHSSKNFREKYYLHVYTTRKRGNEPLLPTQYHLRTFEHGLTPFTEIAEKLGISLELTKELYKSGMRKIQTALGVQQTPAFS